MFSIEIIEKKIFFFSKAGDFVFFDESHISGRETQRKAVFFHNTNFDVNLNVIYWKD